MSQHHPSEGLAERAPASGAGLLARLSEAPVVCAEGYLFELERRGYVQAGPFVPLVVLEHPEAVMQLHREFVRSGSDVVPAFTYYAHREKLAQIGQEPLLEELNRQALQLAKEVAQEAGALFAGDVCNSNVFEPDSLRSRLLVERMLVEQVAWAAEAGVDYVIAETFTYGQEALLAVEVVKDFDLPVVVTFGLQVESTTREGWDVAECAKRLEAAGADVVGLNCFRGPETLLSLLPALRAAVSCPVAALPVPYRTDALQPCFETLGSADHCLAHGTAFPTALDPYLCTRYEVAEFARAAYALGVDYLGLCCGAGPHHVRALAEALGKETAASRYSPDMTQHVVFGDAPRLASVGRRLADGFRVRAAASAGAGTAPGISVGAPATALAGGES